MNRLARNAALAAFALLVPLVQTVGPAPTASGQAPPRPNILVIHTDDQRATDTLEWMPKTMKLFADGGTQYRNAYATTPVCCPARASIMQGRLAHNTGVRLNRDAALFNHDLSIQRYLQQGGYVTGMAGKLLNGWNVEQDPPYFDRWALMKPAYYDTEFNDDGTVHTVARYSTYHIADRVEEFLQDWNVQGDNTPWYLYVNPFAPHGPWQAAPDHLSTDVGTWAGNPAVFERDESDKPGFVKRADHSLERAQEIRTHQLRTLLSVDEMVQRIFQELEQLGEQDTIAFYLSDNGFYWSEHGLTGKNQAYTEAIKIPLLTRWPGRIPTGKVSQMPVANIDVTATIAEVAGVTPDPSAPFDGRSLLSGLERRKMFTESWPRQSRGPWASIRTDRYHYVEYYDDATGAVDFREYYDLTVDPWLLNNLFGDRNRKNDPFPGTLRDELAALRTCVGQACVDLLDQPGVPLRCPGTGSRRGHHLVGSFSADRIRGHPWRDVACGRQSRDRIRGSGAPDRLLGGPGRDVLIGGPGPDRLDGGGGRDVCVGGAGKDRYRSCEVRRG